MSVLGYIELEKYLNNVSGEVTGRVITDGKNRYYLRKYEYSVISDSYISINPQNGRGNSVVIKKRVPLDESLIAFLGLYSGDGAKGVEDSRDKDRVLPSISLSQREPHLVAYATTQFRKLFGNELAFTFQVGEDSAFFMANEGLDMLTEYYNGTVPPTPNLGVVRPHLSAMDVQYINEKRPNGLDNNLCLAFYYQHDKAMKEVLFKQKEAELAQVGITLSAQDRIAPSLRRPFKKGARLPGGSSRSDELTISGVNGFGEIFLKIMHEIEASIYTDDRTSPSGLIEWIDRPSTIGSEIDIENFFLNSPYALIGGRRASFNRAGVLLRGQWPRSVEYIIHPKFRIDPLWCYVSGLYLAEGSTPKSVLFKMYDGSSQGFSFSFTSTENESIELIIRSLKKLFLPGDCINTWKIKVGSQYFPELVVIGLKNGVPMLRGGASGDGKLRSMEISLSVKQWALDVAPCLIEYQDKFSHVEPTGAGIPRIDFSSSSSICKWYFPILLYTVFGGEYPCPNWR